MDVSAIIVEYHAIDDVSECLERTCGYLDGLEHEAIVVSNSSYSLRQQSEIRRRSGRATWIFNQRNAGFARAVNQGIRSSKGRSVFLLNSDVRLQGRIDDACEFLHSRPDVGLLGPRIVDVEGRVQDSCRVLMTPWVLAKRIVARAWRGRAVVHEDKYDLECCQPVDWVIGGCMLVKREAIERVGLMDEGYFLYVEDMDWCFRFWQAGFQVIYFPELTVRYSGDRKSTSFLVGKGMFNRYTVYHLRSYARFVRKLYANGTIERHDPTSRSTN